MTKFCPLSRFANASVGNHAALRQVYEARSSPGDHGKPSSPGAWFHHKRLPKEQPCMTPHTLRLLVLAFFLVPTSVSHAAPPCVTRAAQDTSPATGAAPLAWPSLRDRDPVANSRVLSIREVQQDEVSAEYRVLARAKRHEAIALLERMLAEGLETDR
jgi:hypothetical protein